MVADNRLNELVRRYQEALAEGRPVPPEELCHDCPELLAGLRERIRQLPPAAPSLALLSPDDWDRLQGTADRFEQAWHEEKSVDLQQFLPPPGDPLRTLALLELIFIDVEMNWRRGHPVFLEAYLERFPELGTAPSLDPRLVYEEYRSRHRHGDRPPLAAYRARFPAQFEELERLVESSETVRSAAAAARAPGASVPVGGGCKLQARLGTGAFSEVWRAEAPGGFPVAVKVILRPLEPEEGHRELAALSRLGALRHPSLVPITAFGLVNEQLVVVMELADGSLKSRLQECLRQGLTGVPPAELVGYLRDAAEGLDYLHGQRLLHRDVKPENLLLVGGHAKVADAGLARLQGAPRLSTSTGTGTPLYMAPEGFRGRAGPASDQYSLAITYAEARLGRRILRGTSLMELMQEHRQGTPDLAPLPEAERRVLLRALSKEPAQRYPSCGEFARAAGQAVGTGRQ
jgi:hypothetical protein